jgi:hypothetical protein
MNFHEKHTVPPGEIGMKAKLGWGFAALLFGTRVPVAAQQQSVQMPLSASLPGKRWALVMDVQGFKVEVDRIQPDGRKCVRATNPGTGVTLSVRLERVNRVADSKECPRVSAEGGGGEFPIQV